MKFVDDFFTDISISTNKYLRADKIVEIFWMNKMDLIYLHNISMLALSNKFKIENYSDLSNDFKMKYHQIVFNRYK